MTTSRAGHPGWLRCSSVKYSRYSRSSRLAIRAPRSAIWSLFNVDGPLEARAPGRRVLGRMRRVLRAEQPIVEFFETLRGARRGARSRERDHVQPVHRNPPLVIGMCRSYQLDTHEFGPRPRFVSEMSAIAAPAYLA